MITSKQRSILRGLGNALNPIVQIGKDGLSENAVSGVDLVLEARELVKIKVLKNCETEPKELLHLLAEKTGSDVVQVIGNIGLLYRKSSKKGFQHIQL